jgi:hypothetical protein
MARAAAQATGMIDNARVRKPAGMTFAEVDIK